AALKAELESIDGSAVSGAERLVAPASGLFSAVVDGWEHIGPQALDGLTPTVLDALAAGSRPAEGRVYGKIVTGCDWYFAAAMREADAAGLTPGGAATLVLGRGYGEGVEARVLSVSEPEGGRRAVVFRCDKAMAETMALRRTVAEVRFDRYSGIRVPAGALREEDGESFVWTVTAMQLERKSVEPLYQGDGFAILRRGSDSGALREGDTVVVSGEDLYEGKVMNEF
ncbi:MAG: hypothetical protein IJ705_01310, partial [Oscillospiraceae bacterium]|nr:hypothetical protein [Oscillospiraceae bacterium]